MVPRLLNRIYDGINNQVSQQNFIKRGLFNWGISSKVSSLEESASYTHRLWDKLIFGKIREMLGGKFRMLITGSAPISKENLSFLRAVFCCPIYEAYGLTEVHTPSTATSKDDPVGGHVGGPLCSVEVRLEDILEMNYLTSSNPPQGEICIRGPTVMYGYYKNDKLTAEAIDSEGWFHTGDVGELLPGARVRIIDRKKNIFKLAQGEYIAAEKLENVYVKCPEVAQVFVYGDSLKTHLVAVVTLDAEAAGRWAADNGVDPETLAESDEFKEYLLEDFGDRAREAQFNGLERIKRLHISTEEFTIENGLLTPTLKLMRFNAKKMFKAELDAMYQE
jgi:long-chain acyl-CoA synthetase